MGGRQSSQNARQQAAQSDTNTSRYSVGSWDNDTPVSGRAVMFTGPSTNVELSSNSSGVVRRRRRRDRNDFLIETHSLPAHIFPALLGDIKCPVCNKRIGSNVIESHLMVCLAKPKVSYNEDTLTADHGECIICFEDMCKGDRIARLPCLCIYHKHCLDEWFQRNRCCPEHPDQEPQEYIETLPRNSGRATRPGIEIVSSPRLGHNSEGNDNVISNSAVAVANSLPPNLGSEHSPIRDIDFETPSPSTSLTSPDEGRYRDDRNIHSPARSVSRHEGELSPRTTTVHIEDGSTHGSTDSFDEDELESLTSRKLKIFVVQNSNSGQINST